MPTAFAAALETGDLAALRGVPKADRHNHLLLGAPLAALEAWCGERLPRPPARFPAFADFDAYIFGPLAPRLWKRAGFERMLPAAAEFASADGVSVLEASFDCTFAQEWPDGPAGLAAFVGGLVARFRDRLDLRPELGLPRDLDPAVTVPLAEACLETGVFRSLDLYGTEDARPNAAYAGLYRTAARLGVKRKAHAGEYGDAAFVRETVETLDLAEVQHGIRAAESKDVLAFLAARGTRCNVCPTSNVALGRVAELAAHPVRILVEHGVRVSIAADDVMIFDRSVSEEYLALYRAGVLDAATLETIRADGLRD